MRTPRKTTPHLPLLRQGETLGQYQILRLIAAGGQGQVYLARVLRPGAPHWLLLLAWLRLRGVSLHTVAAWQLCALKLALPTCVDGLHNEHNFLLRRAAGHRHIVRLFTPPTGDSTTQRRRQSSGMGFARVAVAPGETQTLPYLLLAYEPGITLNTLLRRRGSAGLDSALAARITLQVAEALRHLHEQAGLMHNDISPSNIILRGWSWSRQHDIEAVLIDLAVADAPEKRRTPDGGKEAFTAPERLSVPHAPLSPSADVYSLGVTLSRMLGRTKRKGGEPSRELRALAATMVAVEPQARPSIAAICERLRHTPELALKQHVRKIFLPGSALAWVLAVLMMLATLSWAWQSSAQKATNAPALWPTADTFIPRGDPVPVTPVLPTSTPAVPHLPRP